MNTRKSLLIAVFVLSCIGYFIDQDQVFAQREASGDAIPNISIDRNEIKTERGEKTLSITIPLQNLEDQQVVGDLKVSLLDGNYRSLAKVEKKVFLLNGKQEETIALPVSAGSLNMQECVLRIDFMEHIWLKRFLESKNDQELHVVGQNRWISGSRVALRVVVSQSIGGEAIANAQIRISATTQNSAETILLAQANSDANGTADLTFDVPDSLSGQCAISVAVESEFGSDTLQSSVNVTTGTKILLTTDKPVYQPNQLIRIRALAAHKATDAPIADRQITLEAYDGKGNKVFKQIETTSEFGIASADFQLADEVNQGDYKIKAIMDEDVSEKTVNVFEYVLPKFKVTIENEKKFYAPGEEVKGHVEARYFFGKAVEKAKVKIVANCFDVGFNEFATVEKTADAEGKCDYAFTIPEHLVGQPLFKGNTIVQMDVRVLDTADHEEQKYHTFHVATDPIQVDVVPESGSLVDGVENEVYLVASRPDGSVAKPKLAVSSKYLDKDVDLTCDENGIATVTLKPNPSAPAHPDLPIVRIVADDEGKTFTIDKELPQSSDLERILLRPDKGVYTVGHTMQLMILSPLRNETVFLDVIKNDQTVLTRTIRLRDGQSSLSLPLDNLLAGTLALNAYIIRSDGNMIRDTRQVIVTRSDDLQIEITPNQLQYAPGEPATLQIAVRGGDGQPVRAALGLHVVDESVYALSEKEPGLAKVFFAIERELLEPKVEIHGYQLDQVVRLSTKQYEENATLSKTLLSKLDAKSEFTLNLDTLSEKREKVQRELEQIRAVLGNQTLAVNPAIPRSVEEALLSIGADPSSLPLRDPWGNAYEIVMAENNVMLISMGRDGKTGTMDDIEIPNYVYGLRFKDFQGGFVNFQPVENRTQTGNTVVVDASLMNPAGQINFLFFDNSKHNSNWFYAEPQQPAMRRLGIGGMDEFRRVPMMVRARGVRGEDLAFGKKGVGVIEEKLAEAEWAGQGIVGGGMMGGMGMMANGPESGKMGDMGGMGGMGMMGGMGAMPGQPPMPGKPKDVKATFNVNGVNDTVMSLGIPTDDFQVLSEAQSAPETRLFYNSIRNDSSEPTNKSSVMGRSVIANIETYDFNHLTPTRSHEKIDQDINLDEYTQLASKEPLMIGGLLDKKEVERAAKEALKDLKLEVDVITQAIEKELKPAEPQATGLAAKKAEERAVRVRRFFPETLFYTPEVITNNNGVIALNLPAADSITIWRMSAMANTKNGAIGDATAAMKVFKPFFIDLDLPIALIQNDEVTIPVAVYNYLAKPQEVEVSLEQAPWFELLEGDFKRHVQIAANEVTSVSYRICAKSLGKQPLTVYGWGSEDSDAIGRDIEVRPNGEARFINRNGRLRGMISEQLTFPAERIAGADKLFVKIYPGVFSQVVEGLDAILQMPYGCFEQTSSTTYPNILALKYMQDTDRVTPAIEMKAREYINLGYQRLLTFEIAGGGFQVFGSPPATRILSAYGLMEFLDMNHVYPIDQNVIERTKNWLLGQMNADGSWDPDEHYAHAEMWRNIQDNKVLATAYIALALAKSDAKSALQKTDEYLRANAGKAKDAYTLSILCNALLALSPEHATTKRCVSRLVDMGTLEGKNMYWKSDASMSFARGDNASIETTAWAILALIDDGRFSAEMGKALNWLIEKKDPNGTWGTTHGTVLALKAMVESLGKRTEKIAAAVVISVNGEEAERIRITPEYSDIFRQVDATKFLREGENRVDVTLDGEGSLLYQVVGKYFTPWKEGKRKDTPGGFDINVEYDRSELRCNDTVICQVKAKNVRRQRVEMVMIDVGIPPGFRADQPALDDYVTKGKIAKFTIMSRQLLIYIESMEGGQEISLDIPMKATLPMVAKAPESKVYEYYNPDVQKVSVPQELKVN
ncbi:MAG: hypothetical protein C4527_28085 [Candidatus Omnitrophota bacterium]|jgi:uncharacterized protein YfaS (alpha-2-macroglobulin family)|nr:MAG: hypothetical protein C4527_28085 [Candidatus Omnitrophota bacterium]